MTELHISNVLFSAPLFIIQWQFDTFQMYADNVALPASRDQWNYIHQSGRRLRETFNNVSAVFSPSCIAHEVVTMSYWTDVAVGGVSLPDALQCWAASLPAESSHVPSGDYEAADSEDGFTSQKMNALAAPTAGLHRYAFRDFKLIIFKHQPQLCYLVIMLLLLLSHSSQPSDPSSF